MSNVLNEPAMIARNDESYFDQERKGAPRVFDRRFLHEPVGVLATRTPIVLAQTETASAAMRCMQSERTGVVLVTSDGSLRSELVGIFTERDILLRIINGGRDPSKTPLADVMTSDPEFLYAEARVAWVLNLMSVGGFRHVPITNVKRHPVGVIAARDVMEFLVETFSEDILNLPPEFSENKPTPRDGA